MSDYPSASGPEVVIGVCVMAAVGVLLLMVVVASGLMAFEVASAIWP